MLPQGWRVVETTRKSGVNKGMIDRVYYSPNNTRFRSLKEVEKHLSCSLERVQAQGQTTYQKGCFSGKDQYAQTPDEVLAFVRRTIGPFYDPCPANPTEDGLKTCWHLKRAVYINPPYSDLTPWLAKAVEESRQGCTVMALLPARTSPFWFHKYCMKARLIYWVCGGIKFKGYPRRSPFGCMLVLFQQGWNGPPESLSCEFHRESRFVAGVLE